MQKKISKKYHFFSFILEFLIFLKKRHDSSQDIAIVKNEENEEKKKEEEKGKGKEWKLNNY